jgi:hypothetical protein
MATPILQPGQDDAAKLLSIAGGSEQVTPQPQQSVQVSSNQNNDAAKLLSIANGVSITAPRSQNPYPIADGEKGAVNQTLKTGESVLKLPSHIWDALTQPPADDDEKAAANLPGRRLPGQLQLAIYRLVQKPMEKEHEIAKAYQTIAESKKQQRTTPQDNSVTGKIKRVLIGDDDPDVSHAVDMAQVHHIASVVPLLGPLAADITEHFAQGDEGGALASLLSNIAAGKAVDVATKGVGKQIDKVAPKTATVAGESTPVMAGQLKDAAPVAEEVAKVPSAQIAEQQQAAAQQGVKNLATSAANKTLSKLGKSSDEAASFGDASKQIKEAVQPTFKKLDELSDGMFSTFQNKLANANKMIRKATSMEDLEKAETQAGEAQKGIDDLFKHHADEIGADDLSKAKAAYRDQSILSKVHSYVESAFSAPENVADSSGSVTRTLKGNALRPRLNQMLKKIPHPDLERVIGKDGVQSLYEIAKLTEKPEGLADMQNLIGQVAAHGYISKLVKSPVEARNLVARYLATSPRVSHMAINALKFGTPAKIYTPIIASAVAESDQQ